MTDVYIYAALLLHKAGKPITIESVNNLLIGGVGLESTDDARVKLLVEALKDVDIKETASRWAAYVPNPNGVGPSQKVAGNDLTVKMEEPPKDDKDDEGVRGLRDLFGDP